MPALLKKSNPKSPISLEKIPFIRLVLVSLIIGVVTLFLVLTLQKSLPPQVPLFYGLPKTEEQLATSTELVIPSIISIAIIIINILLTQVLDDGFLRRVLILSGVVSIFFSTITTFKIVFLVGSF